MFNPQVHYILIIEADVFFNPDRGLMMSKPTDTLNKATLAVFRFGLGPRPGTLQRLSATPNAAREACLAELANPAIAMIPVGDATQDLERCGRAGANNLASSEIRYQEISRRFNKHLEPEVGFVERLVLFWANHFSMHQEKSVPVRCTIGHFERTVIRRHVLGNFTDMLSAAIAHPAMIGYLDNHTSRATAVNENLGREILELHTLGSAARYPGRAQNYTQADVEALARILTGWTVNVSFNAQTGTPSAAFGQFQFRADIHAERAHTVMGQSFGAAGQAKGLDALKWLASHPNTGEHIATKLLRHFVCDEPPRAMVDQLRQVFKTSQGNLRELARALVQMEAAWTAPPRLRPPHLWLVSQARALGLSADDFKPDQIESHWQTRLQTLNNGVWYWLTPDGFPDRDSNWLNPDAIRMRVLVTNQLLRDAEIRGRALPLADTLRQQLLPGSSRVTSLAGLQPSVHNRAALADLFLSSAFMTR